MATITRFEDMEVWITARNLAKTIYGVSQGGSFARDFKLREQINSAASSIMDNIAEGFERDGVKEFTQFLSIAKGSAGEVRSQLYTALDRQHIPSDLHAELNTYVISIGKQLSGLIMYLRRGNYKGRKFNA